jgi:signal transduction histidine kinase
MKNALRRFAASASRNRKQMVLRIGFGSMIALLIFAGLQANRIQDNAARQNVQVYQEYAKIQDVISEFRRKLVLGSSYTRDLFLSAQPDRGEVFDARLRHLQIDITSALEYLGKVPDLRAEMEKLRPRVREFLDALHRVPRYAGEPKPERPFEWVEEEISHRGNTADALLESMAGTNQRYLRRSESRFEENGREASRRLYLMLGSCLFVGLGVALFSIIYSENLEQKSAQRYEDARRANRELQLLSARLIEIQEEERRNLSRELHDEIGQTLTALRLDISQAESASQDMTPAVQRKLESARSLAEKTIRAVRNISLLLRPSLLDDLGLGPALEWQAEEFQLRTGIHCELTQSGLENRLPDAYNTCVYRVVQEALHNCEKHSSANHVRVCVKHEPGLLTVEVNDDGKGFDINRKTGRLGILGMRERAEGLGGTLTVQSSAAAGTTVTLRLPVVQTISEGMPEPLPAPDKVAS